GIALLTIISLIVVLIDIFFPLSAEQKQFIYVFDLVVVLILAIDFTFRVSNEPLVRNSGNAAASTLCFGRCINDSWLSVGTI
ncbi:MAG: hypothetical protein ACM3X1_01900, partial [Ignavibacteriales bacterium]